MRRDDMGTMWLGPALLCSWGLTIPVATLIGRLAAGRLRLGAFVVRVVELVLGVS